MLQNYEIMDILPHKSAHKLAFNISFCHKTHIYALFMQHWWLFAHLGHLCMALGAALACVHICFVNAPPPSEVPQGGAGPKAGGRNGYGRQKFSFIRQKFLSPATVFSTSRNRFFVSPCLNAPTRDASLISGSVSSCTKRYH